MKSVLRVVFTAALAASTITYAHAQDAVQRDAPVPQPNGQAFWGTNHPPQFKEAIKFGTLGFATLNGLADNIPACSGANGFAVLGKINRPPRDGKLWAHDEAGAHAAVAS